MLTYPGEGDSWPVTLAQPSRKQPPPLGLSFPTCQQGAGLHEFGTPFQASATRQEPLAGPVPAPAPSYRQGAAGLWGAPGLCRKAAAQCGRRWVRAARCAQGAARRGTRPLRTCLATVLRRNPARGPEDAADRGEARPAGRGAEGTCAPRGPAPGLGEPSAQRGRPLSPWGAGLGPSPGAALAVCVCGSPARLAPGLAVIQARGGEGDPGLRARAGVVRRLRGKHVTVLQLRVSPLRG